MRKTIVIFALLVSFSFSLHAGGLFTNTNQSAIWVRMLVRDASTGIDAVYYNPAGVAQLSDGFHISLNNQIITQNKDVTNSLFTLNDGFYRGEVSAPLFPGIYAVYKTDKLAFSFGFNPIGGGGGAVYNNGLPSFETPVSGLVPLLTAGGVPGLTGYKMNTYFEGSSIFFGAQLGVTYAISDALSVYAGGRYVIASNTYNGYLKDILVTAAGTDQKPHDYLRSLAAQAAAGATSASGAATQMQPLIDGGAGGLTFSQAQAGGIIDANTRALLEGGLLQLGFAQTAIDNMTLLIAQGSYSGAATTLTTQAVTLNGTADAVEPQVADKEVDAKQKGSGITPIFGIHFQPNEKLGISFKYEHHTKLELENETAFDNTGLFTDGAITRSDMPTMMSLGINFKPITKLSLQGGVHYYIDKPAYYGKYEKDNEGNPVMDADGVSFKQISNEDFIDKNYLEFGIGIEYALSKKLTVSGGYMNSITGVNDTYQSDLSYSLNSSAIAGGFTYGLNDQMAFTFGFGYAFYQDDKVEYTHPVFGNYTQTYQKDAIFIGLGVDFSF